MTEILAPAGNLFKLKTAVRYGAGAVYLAGRKFGLRSAADNFTYAELAEGCSFAHRNGAQVYVVLNGFLFDEELNDLPPFLKQLEAVGVDAVICSDLGVVETVREFSDLTIHLSTQSSTLNTPAARFWKSRGVKRIVLGREATIEEAGHIKEMADIEVEMFIHGAMCMAYSGNCTISNYTAGRDSNRGGCVQSCRFAYQLSETKGGGGVSGHVLSSKDLQGLAVMDRFVEAGIDSLKIEGRMKSPLYVATATRAYVAALEAARAGNLAATTKGLLDELNSMSHRDYTLANLLEKAGPESVYQHDDASAHVSHDMVGHVVEVCKDRHVAVYLRNPLRAGEPVYLLATDGSTHRLATDVLRGIDGAPKQRCQPNSLALLPYHEAAQADLLLRKPRHADIYRDAARA